jgi:phospholipid/cholesterol/gamma-HCH transport system substrate-binding protein
MNRLIGSRVAELQNNVAAVQKGVETLLSSLREAENAYNQAVDEAGADSKRALDALARTNSLKEVLGERRKFLRNLEDDINRENSKMQNIEVRMRISDRYRDWVRADSSISLGSIGLLGDKYIEISLGRSPDPPETEPMEIDSWFFGTKTEEVVLITGTQQASFAELITGANDILANFETLSGQIRDIMASFDAGQGTVGKFITDPSFYNNLNDTVEKASQAAEQLALMLGDIKGGSGTLTRLIRDEELYVRITSSAQKLERLLEGVEQGEGTLGMLTKDPSIYERSEKFLANLDAITTRIESGEGTLGQLTTNDELYMSLKQSVEELSKILKGVEDGRGTLGRLAQDEELYNNLNVLSAELVKFIYDFRQNPKKFLTIKFELF